MTDRLQNPKSVYPLIGIATALLIMIVGLLTAKSVNSVYFLIGAWLILLLFGYWRACLAILPFAALSGLVLAGLTYLISRDLSATQAAVSRILAVCVAVIPGLSLSPILLVRNCSALKMPRVLTLGMMITLNFPHLLSAEVRQVREAMETRGAGSYLNPRIFYRAFLIPLIIRLVNISDTLAVSVETRGFSTDKSIPYSVYKTVKFTVRDFIYVLMILGGAGLAVFG